VPEAQVRLMLRRLLRERFAMIAHAETRQLDAFALVVARQDGALGPRLVRSRIDCTEFDRAARTGGVTPPAPPQPGEAIPCGFSSRIADGVRDAFLGGRPIANLAIVLQNTLSEPVVDRTGLTGAFDAHLSWAADDRLQVSGDASAAPTLVTALREQLGLRLERTTVPVEVLVIDRIERPAPD
jgi:uncharacterized protein (TIGR03435 family)